jgi:23S rRNA pseudouridine1911/1915/1917 synthase
VTERVVTFSSQAVGQRVDRAIAAELSDLSRTQVQRLIEDGFVVVDGQRVTRSGQRLERPATIRVRIPPRGPAGYQPESIPLDIVYEDDDLIVINKPAGLVVHPAAGHAAGTLVNAVLAHAPELRGVGDAQRPGIVHRLDKDTSGLIVVAKHDAAHRALQRQFKERTVEKIYLALLDGHPPTPTGRIEAAVGRDPRDRQRMAVVPEKHGRMAVTEYSTRERFRAHTLVAAHPVTGRTHQLRLHFAFLKCPVVGDRVYGRRSPSLPVARQCLHAARLTLRLPGSGQARTFEAPPPDDLVQVLKLLRA